MINSSLIKFEFLQGNNLETFLIELENGNCVPKDDLDQFVRIMPTEAEQKKFSEKLAEFNISSF